MMGDIIPSNMEDAAMWALIVGFVSPLVLNFIISSKWSSRTQSLVAFAFSAVVGAVTAIIAGAYAGLGIPSAILLTFVVAIASYQSFWKKVTPNLKRGSTSSAE